MRNKGDIPWSDAEMDLIRDNPTMTDAELLAAFGAAGFVRTLPAVQRKRHYLGLTKRRGPRPGALRRAAEFERTDGWPELAGTPEDRDRQYVRLLARALSQREAA